MAFATDPFDWSIDQVVNALCTSTHWWKDGRPHSVLPDPTSFEQTLREQEVNGYTLLTYVTDQILKDDFGIRAIGRRATVAWAIDKLRGLSIKYMDHRAAQKQAFHGNSPAQSLSFPNRVVPWLHNTPSELHPSSIANPANSNLLGDAVGGVDRDTDTVGAAPRTGESLIQDERGRKRRKLTLADPLTDMPNNDTDPALSKAHQTNFESAAEKFPVDQIFYGDTSFGQALEDDEDLCLEHYGNAPAPFGPYVYRQIRHFLRNPEREEITQGDQRAVAVRPYRASILPANQPRSATLFQVDKGGIRASRQEVSRLDNNLPYDDNDNHEWDYIAEKYAKLDSTVLPALGESDSEEDSSYLAEVEAEERERELRMSKRRPLSVEDVSTIIENRIQELVELWKRKKLPIRERTASAVWRKAPRQQDRASLRTAARLRVQKIEHRLNKLKKAMLDDVWYKEAEVRAVCASLEESICQREEELWRISVWEQKTEPLRLASSAPTKPTKKKLKLAEGEEAGELVNSESELESDGLGGFIEADEDMGAPTTSRRGVSRRSESLGDPGNSAGHGVDVISMSESSDQDSVLGNMADDEDEMDSGNEDKLKSDDEDKMEIDDNLPATPVSKQILASSALQPRSAASIVDLTMLSDTPTPSPVKRTPNSTFSIPPGSQMSAPRFGGDPEGTTYDEVRSWDYSHLEERNDRKRIVLKILRTALTKKEYRDMKNHLGKLSQTLFYDQIWQGMGALSRGERMLGSSDKDWDVIVKFCRLYACWNRSLHKFWNVNLGTSVKAITKIAESFHSPESKRDFDGFFTFVRTILTKYPQSQSVGQAPEKPSEPSDNDDFEGIMVETPHKKRKRKVEQSASAMSLRESAHRRQEAQTEKERRFRERMGSSQPENADRMILNFGKSDDQGSIYIHPMIGSRIKAHQIDGVKFMWREVVEAGHTQPQGCLLAHTMGMGKTMQVITLLTTIADAAKSSDETIRAQIPKNLQLLRTLIMCPASLIQNWVDELCAWVPQSSAKNIGNIRHINAEMSQLDRMWEIAKWHKDGGILIISYDILGALASAKKNLVFSEEQRKKIRKNLLEGPTIIIADEAHKMKSTTSLIRQVAEKFQSKSRIALTGSPLANNLEEYWSMIDWIAPGYMGTLKEFKAHFVEPIQEGLYRDSSRYENRKALKKLRVLKNEIAPKIHRADITVLKDDLKAKYEFLITVPLTTVQEDLYKICVRHVTGKSQDEVSAVRLWHWIGFLTLLCNHPAAFLKGLKRSTAGKRSRGNVDEDVGAEQQDSNLEDQERGAGTKPGPKSPEQKCATLPPDLIAAAEELSREVQNLDSPSWSYKTQIFLRILRLAKAAGDQVLVFSYTLPTLDYLESLIMIRNLRYARLDGKVKMSDRPRLLEKFNKGEFDIFLISTRAGGTGLNMPRANRVVIFDFGFNPQAEEQAIGRAYRIGQKKEVFVYRMLAGGTFETKIWNKALFKTQLACRVIDTKNPERHAEKMKDYLFDPLTVSQEDLTEHEGKDVQVLDKILGRIGTSNDPGIRAITTTETLMKEDIDAHLDIEEVKEVEQMIKEEKLRKENPAEYDRRFKDRMDSHDMYLQRMQSALFQEAADISTGPPPAVLPRPRPAPPMRFNVQTPSTMRPSGTAPATAEASTFRAPNNTAPPNFRSMLNSEGRLDGLPSSAAGINNAGPSPARKGTFRASSSASEQERSRNGSPARRNSPSSEARVDNLGPSSTSMTSRPPKYSTQQEPIGSSDSSVPWMGSDPHGPITPVRRRHGSRLSGSQNDARLPAALRDRSSSSPSSSSSSSNRKSSVHEESNVAEESNVHEESNVAEESNALKNGGNSAANPVELIDSSPGEDRTHGPGEDDEGDIDDTPTRARLSRMRPSWLKNVPLWK